MIVLALISVVLLSTSNSIETPPLRDGDKTSGLL
jgi:hypothetical protein